MSPFGMGDPNRWIAPPYCVTRVLSSIARMAASDAARSGPRRHATKMMFVSGDGCPIGTATLIVSSAPTAEHSPGLVTSQRALAALVSTTGPVLGSGCRIRLFVHVASTPPGGSSSTGQVQADPLASGGCGDAEGATAHAGRSGSVEM